MNEETIKTLEKLDLTEKEAKVYLGSLKLGMARATDISKEAGILRETTYGIIDSLISKGLMSHAVKSGVKHFEASSPETLTLILEEKKKALEKVMPELKQVMKAKRIHHEVELYEGKKGIKSVHEDILKSNPDIILTMSSNKNLKKVLKYYFPSYIDKRIKNKIPVKLLTDGYLFPAKLVEYKFLPKNFNIKTTNYIYGDKIASVTLDKDEQIGVIIKNKHIAQTQRRVFDLLWNMLPESPK